MRKPILVVLVALSLVVVALGLLLLRGAQRAAPVADQTPAVPALVDRIGVEELNALVGTAGQPLIWEFVGEEQFSKGHLPGAELMTFDGLPTAAQKLDRKRAIVTVCT